ncbi:skin secretory protein xP2-like isoform X2 [Onychomys torridus]|uniref:skin secretory protein xP2-like isoform X2 n=1 Tax=Onychomys torridus TaxID=38674 RepID=UPI00167FB1A0|nr:skin secretory protein xP2-like isoform X2 [Onychomys torridus]
MCSLAPPLGGVSPAVKQSATRPPPSRNGVALPYLRPLTPEAKWTCPSAVCQLPGLCGKMDPPARRRVGSRCLTRPLLGVGLSPGRQENQHPERPVSPAPTHSRATRGLAKTRAPLPAASGTARILRSPRCAARPCPADTGRPPGQPAPGRAAASSPREVATSPRLPVPGPRVRQPLGQGPRGEPRAPALARLSLPSPRWWQRRPWTCPCPPPDGSSRLGAPAAWQVWGDGPLNLPPRDLRKGAAGILSSLREGTLP